MPAVRVRSFTLLALTIFTTLIAFGLKTAADAR